MMKGLLTPLAVKRHIDDEKWDGKTYVLTKDLKYLTKAGKTIRVPAGFRTDFASWVRRRGRFEEGAVIHDWLYATKAGRSYADRIFKEVMERAGCSRWRIIMMYWGVRLFASPWYYLGAPYEQ